MTMTTESGVTRTQLIDLLSKSVHGRLEEYKETIQAGARQDPEFTAHLIAWDAMKGQIKDLHQALPVLSIAEPGFPQELVENSLAHLALLSPREILKAFKFAISFGTSTVRGHALDKLIRKWLSVKLENPGKWMGMAARHRRSLKTLHALTHTGMPGWASEVLHGSKVRPEDRQDYLQLTKHIQEIQAKGLDAGPLIIARNALRIQGKPQTGIFHAIASLNAMSKEEAAQTIQKFHLSPLIVTGAMAGGRKEVQESSIVVQAGMDQMSATELVTRTRGLERKGIASDKVLKENFRTKIAKASKSSKATLKSGVKAQEVEDEGIRQMLQELQERQIQAQKDAGKGIDGNVLVIVDKSQSQEHTIELGRHIGGAIAKFVTGNVYLMFCDVNCQAWDVTGKTLEEIQSITRFVFANGSTSYGIGLYAARERKLPLDLVVIVGDGGENTAPFFCQEWHAWVKWFGKELPVYFYQTYCEPKFAMTAGGNPRNFEILMSGNTQQREWIRAVGGSISAAIPFTKFDLTHGKVDYYSVPNMVQQMKLSKFGLEDQIMATKLLTMEDAWRMIK